jgi:aryl-alcohol dehydrogenase-like predicted oxidoreductase
VAHPYLRRLSRRQLIERGLLAGAAWTVGTALAAESKALITKAIPSSGEKLPVVGLGTNNYSVSAPNEIADRRAVLQRMPELGGSVVDTAPAYGQSEAVIGEIVAGLGNRDKLFLATKVTAPNSDVSQGKVILEESFKRLRVPRIDLVQVHNLTGTDAILPVLEEWKKAGKIRYIGITTSNARQYPDMLAAMKKHTLDFIQVDYSLANRAAADEILPLAQERKMGVLVNMPFGGRRGGNLFAQTKDRPLPDFASEIDVSSWSQLFLKYVVSHPAVTVAIPGTTSVKHLDDNQQAARGRLPDAALRKRLEQLWDARV